MALATDLNPGTSPTLSLPLVMSIACVEMGLTPAEALAAVTINAAHSLGLGAQIGSIEPGKQADLVVWDVPPLEQIPYWLGARLARTVVKRGPSSSSEADRTWPNLDLGSSPGRDRFLQHSHLANATPGFGRCRTGLGGSHRPLAPVPEAVSRASERGSITGALGLADSARQALHNARCAGICRNETGRGPGAAGAPVLPAAPVPPAAPPGAAGSLDLAARLQQDRGHFRRAATRA